MTLKGVNQPELLYLVVGNIRTLQSESFRRLQEFHSELLAAMAGGQATKYSAEAVERCKSVAIEIEPGLVSFYDRISDRLGDFQFKAID